MISLSNGILKNKDSGSLHLSEVSLEAFTVSENKKETEKNIQMKKTTSKDPSDAGQETDADEHMEQEEKQESEQKETEGSISAEFILDQARRKTEALLGSSAIIRIIHPSHTLVLLLKVLCCISHT
ncbi:MAG: hypothetical protein ACLU79_09010 [Clostridium sp.]